MCSSTLASPYCDSLKLVQKRPISDESELCGKMLPWKVHLHDCNSNFWVFRPCWHGPWTWRVARSQRSLTASQLSCKPQRCWSVVDPTLPRQPCQMLSISRQEIHVVLSSLLSLLLLSCYPSSRNVDQKQLGISFAAGGRLLQVS